MKIIILLLLFSGTVGLASCQKNTFAPVNQEEQNLDNKSAILIEADNALGIGLFKNIRKTSREENLMVSPLSISIALAMAYNGADNETKAEMEETMKLNGLSREQINNSNKKLISALQSLDEKVVFEIASAIFYDEDFSVNKDFITVNREIYNAEVSGLNFSSPSAVPSINSWVDKKTHGKIERIVAQLNPLDRMLLLNAIYFFGTWSNEFDKNGTKKLQFTKSDGTTLNIPMMNKLETIPYLSTAMFKAVKIPYGTGQFNMVVFLPQRGKSSHEVIENLDAGNWKDWMKQFEVTERVDITMPRFKFAYETSLNDVLASMGMKKAFIPESADFSSISAEELYISEIRHKTFIDVNESGTEAAAVTSVTFATTSMVEEPPVVPFFVDRPFVFAITENESGAILFLGEVNHPDYN